MPKTQKTEFVLHDWIANLTFQKQALLLTGMRGPDGMAKEHAAKCIIRYLRGVVLKPADEVSDNSDGFMWFDYEHFTVHMDYFWDNHDECPHHFLMHLIHCAEVVAYDHPDKEIALIWAEFYEAACKSMHMQVECFEDYNNRLNDFKTW